MFMVLFLSGLAEGLGRAVISGIDNMDADYFLFSESDVPKVISRHCAQRR